MPIKKILKFNADSGALGLEESLDEEDSIKKRMKLISQRKSFKTIVSQPNGLTIEISGSPLPQGGYVTAFNDVTEFISIQKQLTKSKEELEQRVEERTSELNAAKLEAEKANVSKTKFLAAAGHDLMQPFNAASIFANLIHRHQKEQEHQALSTGLINALDNAHELLNMLLDMTKLESGLITPQFSHFKLDDLLSPLTQEYSILAAEKGIKLRYVKTDVSIYCDKHLLSRILQNLLSNAVKYTESGRILIGVRRVSTNLLKVCVNDTGLGIPSDKLDFIFEEFKQVPHTGSTGLGLGLTIVKKLSNLLDIDVTVSSLPNFGTQFQLLAKRSRILNHELSTSHEKIQTEVFESSSILIIENDKLIIEAMTKMLQSWGANVLSCSHKHHLDQLDNAHVDAVIIDYHLDNDQNGVDLYHCFIERKNTSVPGILVTANREEYIQKLAQENKLKYLTKPIKEIALKRLLKQILAET